MQASVPAAPVSATRRWAGRILTALPVLFLLFDGVTKLVRVAPVLEAFTRLGFPASLAVCIGIILLACTAIYVIPQTAVLGAVLLTGYLGGATAIQMRSGAGLFPTLFPVLVGALVWAGLYLREGRLRALVPLRH
ncbi:MAG TPA: DoxX family protein [bacterium]|nr:DoxX family protein [bacterium]